MRTIKFTIPATDLDLFRVACAKSLAETSATLARAAESLSDALLEGHDHKLIDVTFADTEAAGRDLAETELVVRNTLSVRDDEALVVEGSGRILHPIAEIMVQELAADTAGCLQEANYDRAVNRASAMQGWVERAEYADNIVQRQLAREHARSDS